MWMVVVVVRHVLGEDWRQIAPADDECQIGAFPADGAHPAFRERVRSGCLRWGLDHINPRGGELRIAIAQQEPQTLCPLVKVYQQVSRLLRYPDAGRVRGHPDDVDLSSGDLDEEQHVDPLEQNVVHREEAAGQNRLAWAVRNCLQVGPDRHGAGSMPALCRIFHTERFWSEPRR